jgi:hypothetical protein
MGRTWSLFMKEIDHLVTTFLISLQFIGTYILLDAMYLQDMVWISFIVNL